MSTDILSRIKALGYVPPFKFFGRSVRDSCPPNLSICEAFSLDEAKAIADALNEACREEAGQWIKVSERLPESGDRVWVHMDPRLSPCLVTFMRYPDRSVFKSLATGECALEEVTHWNWMPCPTPRPPTGTQPNSKP